MFRRLSILFVFLFVFALVDGGGSRPYVVAFGACWVDSGIGGAMPVGE